MMMMLTEEDYFLL